MKINNGNQFHWKTSTFTNMWRPRRGSKRHSGGLSLTLLLALLLLMNFKQNCLFMVLHLSLFLTFGTLDANLRLAKTKVRICTWSSLKASMTSCSMLVTNWAKCFEQIYRTIPGRQLVVTELCGSLDCSYLTLSNSWIARCLLSSLTVAT